MFCGYGYYNTKQMNISNDHKNDDFYRNKLRFAYVHSLGRKVCRKLKSGIYGMNICGKTVSWDYVDNPAIHGSSRRNKKKFLGTCTGDNGGTLVYLNKAIGVLSKNVFDCNESEEPATYTKVVLYLDFIKNSMKEKPSVIVKTFNIHVDYL